MKRLLLWSIILAVPIFVPVPAMAGVDVSIGISLPPPIVFSAPPEVIVVPDADDVYVVPDVDVDIFFWGGWWWRPWEGRWYRSRHYDRGWGYYRDVPRFYYDVDPGWRGHYRDHDWYGHRWNYERIPNQRLQRNWRSWHDNRRWERRGTWGVRDYRPRPQPQRRELRQQRQEQYRQRPEVQRHQQERLQEQRRPRVQQPQRHQPEVQRPQRQQQPQPRNAEPRGRERQGESRDQRPQGRPERGDAERGR